MALRLISLTIFSLQAFSLFADNRTKLGLPEVKGEGCDQNSVGVTLSPDQSALSILFDKFVAEAKGDKKNERKNCRIIIPLDLDADETISVFNMDYRGYTFLPKGASSSLMVDHWFGGKEGQGTVKRFQGELDTEYLFTDSVQTHKKHWAPCGRPIRLQIQAAIQVKTNEKGEQALVSVDTLDIAKGITYRLERKKCRREKDERWDNPNRRREEDKKERDREKDRDDRFRGKPHPDHKDKDKNKDRDRHSHGNGGNRN